MKKLTKEVKDSIVEEVRATPVPGDAAGCLWWSMRTIEVLERHGIRGILQAGTMMWPRIKPEEDDGVITTHFSYVWDSTIPMKQKIMTTLLTGKLPEVHVWVSIPGTYELLDVTTRYLPEQCEKLTGLPWTSAKPPDYLWTQTGGEGVIYFCELEAVQFLRQLADAMQQAKTTGVVTF